MTDPTTEPIVSVRELAKAFRREDGSQARAIDGVSLDVTPGEFVVLLGPSGCGKTTLLRSIAGLEQPDAGSIAIRGKTVFAADAGIDVPPERRRLVDDLPVLRALAAHDGVPERRLPAAEPAAEEAGDRRSASARVFELVGIAELQRSYPGQMSGGQQQRVALARALAGDADLILFDEPLSNVDAKVREQLRVELLSMQRELGFAALYVTHDQAEAMELAHRWPSCARGRSRSPGRRRRSTSSPRRGTSPTSSAPRTSCRGRLRSVDGGVAVVETELGEVRGVATDGVARRGAGRRRSAAPSAPGSLARSRSRRTAGAPRSGRPRSSARTSSTSSASASTPSASGA